MAYEPDTHFQITYIICRTAGFTAAEALKVAAADQGMDDSPDTVANTGAIPHVEQEWMWHALDLNGNMGPAGVIARKKKMFEAAKNAAPAHQLLLLGVFFHFQQDTWAHRHHYDGNVHSYSDYTTYNTPLGHAFAGHQPDRPPFDPVTAIMDMEDGLKWAVTFLVDTLHRQPRPFVNNYQSLGGTVNPNWSQDGKYFHNLNNAGTANSPRRFFTDIIKTQVNTYNWSIDPMYGLRDTANEVDLNLMAANLQKICNLFKNDIGTQIDIPSTAQKESEHCMTLTTNQLIGYGMPKN